ncbi:hypothetical protein ASF60_23060 [Methylobacterium sp. Leaf113]|nr:hypothetical protein ASF60_23060 [Methylobacterium sp. Leaf113]
MRKGTRGGRFGAGPRASSAAQRSSWSTLCCAWFVSERAEMPSDWRVERAWELAASSLRSAFVRLAAPVSRMLMSYLEKS